MEICANPPRVTNAHETDEAAGNYLSPCVMVKVTEPFYSDTQKSDGVKSHTFTFVCSLPEPSGEKRFCKTPLS